MSERTPASVSHVGRTRRRRAPRSWRGLLLPALLLLLWQWASQRGDVAAYIFVPLGSVFSSLLQLLDSGELLVNLGASLRRTSLGLVIGASLGIASGSLMALSLVFNRLFGPLYHSLRQVPLLALVPLIGLWFGSGEAAKLLIIVLAAFYPAVLNTCEALRQVQSRYLEVGRVLSLSRWQTFTTIQLPSALPGIFTGLSHALAFAWLSSMGSELLFTTGPGLGSLLMVAENGGRMDIVIVCVCSISLIGYAMNRGSDWLRGRLVRGLPPAAR